MKKWLLSLLAGLLLMGVVPGRADTIYAVFKGKVGYGYDYDNLFGTSGANLAEEYAFTAAFVFDSTISPTTYHSTPIASYLQGGTEYAGGTVTPLVTAVIYINGYSQTFNGDYWGTVLAYDEGGATGHTEYVPAAYDSNVRFLTMPVSNNLGDASGLGPSIFTSFNHTIGKDDDAIGSFSDGVGEFLYLWPETLSVVVTPSATPLPAALPLFASGVGGLAWMQRRRRRVLRKSAAA